MKRLSVMLFALAVVELASTDALCSGGVVALAAAEWLEVCSCSIRSPYRMN